MFVLLAGPRVADGDGVVERMAAELRGGNGQARFWVDSDRGAAAASVKPWFVPEDAYDVQPLASAERLFVCQARLDNRAELIERLRIAPDAPVADSAVLAAAYDRWGAECVHEVVGDFAFAAWHRGDGRVVAAVDPNGSRRILWSRVGSGIALSPQLPALLQHPSISNEPDFEALARLLDVGIDRQSAPVAAVRAIPGGYGLIWSRGDARIERWWQPSCDAAIWYRDPVDYVEETRELLTRSVAAQLRSSSPVSTTLSGGLDSGCVTAIATSLLPAGARMTAYTSVPEAGLAASQRVNWEADDTAYAAAVANTYGNIDHRLVAPAGRSVLDVLEPVVERSAIPPKTATNLLWLDSIAASMLRKGSRVLLVGQQGNAGFSWRGESTVWELAQLGRLRQAAAQAVIEARGREKGLAWVLAGAGRDGLRALRRKTVGDALPNPGPQIVRAGWRASRTARTNEYAHAPGSRGFRAAVVTTPKHIWWPEPVAQWGIEVRDPTADRRLLERVLRYPQAAFRAGGRPRGLARELAAPLLPDEVRLRRTNGAQVPEAPALISAHAASYRQAISRMRSSPAARELLDLDALGACVESFAAGSQDYYLALMIDRAFGVGLFLLSLEGRS